MTVEWPVGEECARDLADPDPQVRRAAVELLSRQELAPHLPALVRDADPGIRERAGSRWVNHDPAALALLAVDAEPRVRAAAAANWFTPVERLTALAADPDPWVLEALVRNRLAPPAALARLAETLADRAAEAEAGADGREPDHDEVEERRRLVHEVLDHPATPTGSLRRLYDLELTPYFHRGNAMSQPNWPPDLLVRFGLGHCAGTVEGEADRASLARIERAAEEGPAEPVLAEMIASPVYYLRAAVANRHVPPEALAEFVRTADRQVDGYHLDDLARNPAAPCEILLGWAAEGRRCAEMLANPELPLPVLDEIVRSADAYHAAEARDLLEVRRLREAARREAPRRNESDARAGRDHGGGHPLT